MKFKPGDIVTGGLIDPDVALIIGDRAGPHEREYEIFMPDGPASAIWYVETRYLDSLAVFILPLPIYYLIIEYIEQEYSIFQLAEIIEK